ncbi:MAG TPA: prepilin-type N-terminal cleavage/methylation domain-containing protein [Alphaproteobacteria bacterium]|jgi:general secretion pathway protein I|nr:prepilin-type N-terminal cleavage/methylation domain-containing protein [Alphaproteobacteria bacterium]
MTAGGARQRGFTLIEVLVAFAIAALALGLLFQAASSSGTAAHQAGNYEEAVSRAKSHMAMVGREADVAPGEREGDDGGGYRWRVKITQSAVTQPPQGSSPQNRLVLYNVEVSVSWSDSGKPHSVLLHTQRTGTQPGAANG